MNNTGNLRVNKSKTSPNHKDYVGKVNIEGKEYWIAGWKKSKDGDEWLSLSFEPVKEPSL